MSNQRYSPEFKDEAVRQIVEGGHSTTEVAARLGVSANSPYKWVKAVRPNTVSLKDDELTEAYREQFRIMMMCRVRQVSRSDIMRGPIARYRTDLETTSVC